MCDSIQDNMQSDSIIPVITIETECTTTTDSTISCNSTGNKSVSNEGNIYNEISNSEIKMEFESSDTSNSISKIKMESESSNTSFSSNTDVSFNIHEMKQEEKRLKRTLQQEEKMQRKKAIEEEELRERKERAIKGMNYLLSNSQKYSKFFIERLSTIKNSETTNMKSRKPLVEVNSSQKQDYEEKVEDKPVVTEVDKKATVAEPLYFVGTLQKHQVEGFIWLKLLYENGVNGILADEMGLGKTVQVIALICNMIEQKIPGPFLIVAPLSTLPNWYSEFKRFAPKIPVVIFHGPAAVRMEKHREILKKYAVDNYETAPVVLTSYQVPLSEAGFLKRFRWQYLIIDEGHRIKNFKCRLICVLKSLKSMNRLLLTGTPLQNNLLELWSLLNFLLPQFFQDANTFSSLFVIEDFQETDKIIQQEQTTNIISTIHGVLSPFMLRRLKVDVLTDLVPKKEVMVYCPMTELQRNLYTYILQRNIGKLLNKEEDESEDIKSEGRKRRKCTRKVQTYSLPESDDEFDDENSPEIVNSSFSDNVLYTSSEKKSIVCQVKMSNAMIMMKKAVNHPYLIQCPVVPGTREIVINEQIIEQSGKMMVLDAMLTKLKLAGHKVLVFSTMTTLLDLIEDYLHIRGYQYCRIDGKRSLENRQENIHQFNTDPEKFVFLISTRAGGLGLNLTAADTVILYDRDWNPQVDIQAQDRCHRIGQTKPVVVYTFVTKGTVDERIISHGTAKRRLEKIVIKKGKFTNPEETPTNLTDLKELEELLNSVDHNQVIHSNGYVFTDIELNRMLDRSDLYAQMEQRKKAKDTDT